MKRLAAVLVLLALGASPQEAAPDREGVEFFEKKIRPVLIDRCYSCHSAEAKKLKGELYVDSRDGLLKGGETGPSIVPGDPDKSLLIQALRYSDDLKMPPKGKLAKEVVEDFVAWVKRGAPDPRGKGATAARKGINIEAGKTYWAFQPLKPPAGGSIDALIGAKRDAAGIPPNGPADKRKLIRRATFDLIGLPPEPAEVEAFVRDDSPQAFEKVVERLLASP
ncbi:MAG: DUF1549 domain-containing protein, partial [Planctomycetaceae bacterium]|nr:DUF1549 domain-containing protein [Planctomycetaceae bacterium]